MKKDVSILLAISILISLFGGCSLIGETSSGESNETSITSETTLTETSATTIGTTETQKVSVKAADMGEEAKIVGTELNDISQPLFMALYFDNLKNLQAPKPFSLGVDIFAEERIRQIFIGEVLKSDSTYDSKWVKGIPEEKDGGDDPEFIEYDIFNNVYKAYFGKDFDNTQATQYYCKTNLDGKGYVYYDNHRDGMNGMGNNLTVDNVSYDETNQVYTAEINVEYLHPDRYAEGFNPVGKSNLKYKRDSNKNIIVISYIITE